MSAADLKRWMEEHDVTEVDIASALRVHPETIRRYLKGNNVHRSTKASIARFIADRSHKQPSRKAVGQ